MTKWGRTSAPAAVGALVAALSLSCGGAGFGLNLPVALDNRGVDLEALFAPPTDAELEAVRASWRARDLSPRNVEVLHERAMPDGRTLRIVGHEVGGARHVGAVFTPGEDVPVPPGGFPVAVWSAGFGPPFEIHPPMTTPSPDSPPNVTVFPAFRGQTLLSDDDRFEAGGERFDQCDGGGDDALALVNVAMQIEPRASPDRVVAAGGSRGGNVSLLLGIRDPRVEAVVSIAGPTDYLERRYLDDPNLDVLYEEWFIRELLAGSGDVAEARRRMLACSPVYFVEDLPATQLHHGDADEAVPVATVRRLFDAWRAARGDADERLEVFVYEGEGHGFESQREQMQARLVAFLRPFLRGETAPWSPR